MERFELDRLFENNLLKIKVIPNSRENEIISYDQDKKELKVKLKAQPEKGKANQELILFFKKQFKMDISIVKGFTSRNKIIRIKKEDLEVNLFLLLFTK